MANKNIEVSNKFRLTEVMDIHNIKEAKELILALDSAEFIQKELENMTARNNAAHDYPILVASLVNFIGNYPGIKDELASFMGKKVEEIKECIKKL